jgi:hypothetical protein
MQKFIPVRLNHLVDRLAEDFFPDPQARKKFYDFARLTGDLERHFAGSKLHVIQELYSPYDPDDETVPAQHVAPEDDRARVDRLFEWIERAFEKANFERLTNERFEQAVGLARGSSSSVMIDPGLASMDRVAIFFRGEGKKAHKTRSMKKFMRELEVESPTFSRAGMVIRSRKDPSIHLKLYKEVAQEDIGLGLPTVRLKMRWIDRLKLAGSGGAAVVGFVKLLNLAVAYAIGISSLGLRFVLLPLCALIAGAFYGGKTLVDYTKIRAGYLSALMEQLYSLNVASNRGVLTHLAELVSEEETKEILIGYAIILAAGERGLTAEKLGPLACDWIRKTYATEVAFDVPDSIGKLDERGLVRRGHDGESRIAYQVFDAVGLLDKMWDELYEAEKSQGMRPTV